MEEKTKLKILLFYTIGYILLFTIIAIFKKNYEFLYYTLIMGILIIFVGLYHKKIHLSYPLLVGLTLLGSLHIFGGNLHFAGVRLYDIWLIEGIFKYDNLVHAFGIFVATFVAYNIITPHLDIKTKDHPVLLSILLILITAGMGAFNEILEFGAVVFLNASTQVGDYFNNALDLVFNFLGSIIACFFIYFYKKTRT